MTLNISAENSFSQPLNIKLYIYVDSQVIQNKKQVAENQKYIRDIYSEQHIFLGRYSDKIRTRKNEATAAALNTANFTIQRIKELGIFLSIIFLSIG